MMEPHAQAAHTAATIAVLCVDPEGENRSLLEAILHACPRNLYPEFAWTWQQCDSLESAAFALKSGRFPLVICESDLKPGTWRDLVELADFLPAPPLVIVTSRVADERLWAEVLNLGAYDVLAKPFDCIEVTRVLSMAWIHWREQHGSGLKPKLVALAGVA